MTYNLNRHIIISVIIGLILGVVIALIRKVTGIAFNNWVIGFAVGFLAVSLAGRVNKWIENRRINLEQYQK